MRSVWPNGLAEMWRSASRPSTATTAAELVEMKLRGEIEAEDLAARNAAPQALVAAGEALPGDDDAVEQHLHRERDEGEIVRAEANADCADAERDKGRDQHREHGGNRQRKIVICIVSAKA